MYNREQRFIKRNKKTQMINIPLQKYLNNFNSMDYLLTTQLKQQVYQQYNYLLDNIDHLEELMRNCKKHTKKNIMEIYQKYKEFQELKKSA